MKQIINVLSTSVALMHARKRRLHASASMCARELASELLPQKGVFGSGPLAPLNTEYSDGRRVEATGP